MPLINSMICFKYVSFDSALIVVTSSHLNSYWAFSEPLSLGLVANFHFVSPNFIEFTFLISIVVHFSRPFTGSLCLILLLWTFFRIRYQQFPMDFRQDLNPTDFWKNSSNKRKKSVGKIYVCIVVSILKNSDGTTRLPGRDTCSRRSENGYVIHLHYFSFLFGFFLWVFWRKCF